MVSIIILSYNTKVLLEKCLQSIVSKIKNLDYEIIVVDNASTDDSLEMLKKFQKVKVIKSQTNLGFAKGVNLGVDNAIGEYLLLLNSDIEIITEDLTGMFKFLKDHDDVAVVGGKLDNADGSTSDSYGSFYNLSEVARLLFKKSRTTNSSLSLDPIEVDWVSGGFMAIKKSIFSKLDGLDPNFFMYIEDMEFCYRLNKNGFKVYYDPRYIIKHVGQGSSNRAFAIINIFKGILYFYKKQKPKWQYILVKTMLIIKGNIAILTGRITNNSYLVDTYSKALKF